MKRQGWMHRADWKGDGPTVAFDTQISGRSMPGKLGANSARMQSRVGAQEAEVGVSVSWTAG